MNTNRKHGGLICGLGLNFTFFDFFSKVMYDNKFEPKENKI